MSEFCEICGLFPDEHPTPKPGPPQPPPDPRYHDGIWRPSHNFTPSQLTVAELLDERDAQINHWRRRYFGAQRNLDTIHGLSKRPRRDADV